MDPCPESLGINVAGDIQSLLQLGSPGLEVGTRAGFIQPGREVQIICWVDFDQFGIDLLDCAIESHGGTSGLGLNLPGEVLDTVPWDRGLKGFDLYLH